MKAKNLICALCVVALSSISISSCQRNTEEKVLHMQEIQEQNAELGANILKGMKMYPEKDFYILYDALENDYAIFSEASFAQYRGLAIMLSGSSENAEKGWTEAGKGKSTFDAIRIAKRIAEVAGKSNYEVRGIQHKDGSFTVYYRIIKS